MKTTLGVDGNWIIHRAFYTTPEDVENRGDAICKKFVSMVCKDALANKATHILVAFDGARIFRYKLYPDYKANREKGDGKTPYDYLDGLIAYLNELGIKVIQNHRYEADDVLCSLAKNTEGKLVISTKDKDAFQYLRPGVVLYDSSAKPTPTVTTHKDTKKRLGVDANLCLDLQTLLGDSIDNVPQLVSKAKAIKGLTTWGSIKEWLANDKTFRKEMRKHKEELTLNRKLVRLVSTIEDAVADKPKWSTNKDVTAYVVWKDFANPKSKGLF